MPNFLATFAPRLFHYPVPVLPAAPAETALLPALRRQPEWARAELLALLRDHFPGLSAATLAWRIHDLCQRGLLHAHGRGRYAAQPPRPEFVPALDAGTRRLLRQARLLLPPATPLCLTDTAALNQLRPVAATAAPLPSYRLLEAPKAHLPALYAALLDHSRLVFLAPPPADVRRYVLLHERAVLLRPLPTEAPLLTLPGDFPTSPLEKLLVDALAHADLFDHCQPELPALFRYATQHFALNHSRLRRYARRRNLLAPIEQLLLSANPNPQPLP